MDRIRCEVAVRTIPLLLCCLLVAVPASAKKAPPKAPPASDEPAADDGPPSAGGLIETAQAALGGPRGGHPVLAALPGYRLSYKMEMRDHWAGQSFTAKHVYERGLDASVRLEVKVVSGEGKDSVAFVGADEAWIDADGERADFTPDEVMVRVDDFAPETLFQVPLDLADRGIESLPAQVRDRLQIQPPEGEDAAPHPVLVALDDAGEEQLRLVLHEGTGRPLEASFASVAGRITYRFDDYRLVADGLVVPFSRTFLRNDVQLSQLTVTNFEVLGEQEPRKAGGGK